MDDGVAHLGSIIAAHLREWDTSPAFVELAIFKSDDARVIAAAIDAFCARHLGARVAGGLFHQSSIGSVTGVMLSEARAFVGDYETARGSSFSPPERRLCAAAFAYSCAYTARCGHALGKDERGEAGTFAHLAWMEREGLLAL